MDIIEFYRNGVGQVLTSVRSSMIPPTGAMISIRGITYRVSRVTYAADYSDKAPSERQMRACVDLVQEPDRV